MDYRASSSVSKETIVRPYIHTCNPAAMATTHAAAPTTRDIPTFSIISAHVINKKITQCLNILYPVPTTTSISPDPALLPSVALSAKSFVASKAITIAEIMKRRISEKGDQWYQYTVLSSTTEEKKQQPKNKDKKNGEKRKGKEALGEGEGDEEDPYQTMEEKLPSKKRKVPLLTIYISRSPLPELKRLYGLVACSTFHPLFIPPFLHLLSPLH